MTIPIHQSELNAVGFPGYFPNLPYSQRIKVAAAVLDRVGRDEEAFLLQINNFNAIQGIVYVADVPFVTTVPAG